MFHGSTDKQTTWCGESVHYVSGWQEDANYVECIECLRAKLHAQQQVVDEVLRVIREEVYGLQDLRNALREGGFLEVKHE